MDKRKLSIGATAEGLICEAAKKLRIPQEKLYDCIERALASADPNTNVDLLIEEFLAECESSPIADMGSALTVPTALTRRDVLIGSLNVVAAALITFEKRFYDHLLRRAREENGRRSTAEEVVHLFSETFGRQGRISSYYIGEKGIRDGGGYHPDNLAAGTELVRALGLLPGKGVLVNQTDKVFQYPDGDLIVVGGPVSNPISKIAFEFEGRDPRRQKRRDGAIVPLQWWGMADESDYLVKQLPLLNIYMENEGLVPLTHWPLCVQDGEPMYITAPLINGMHKPLESFLTITRLPNFVCHTFSSVLNDRRPEASWPSLLVIDGRNGVATRAAELLTQVAGLKALARAKKAISNSRVGFQILFKLGDLWFNKNGGFDQYRSIEFVEAAIIDPPQELWLKAHKYAYSKIGPKMPIL